MAVNLLPQATVKEQKKADSSLKGVVYLSVWIGILVGIFVILFFYKGIEQRRLTEVENQKQRVINDIVALGTFHDDYYTLSYKTNVLSKIRTEQYIPSIIGDYIKENIENRGTVSQYRFDANGSISIYVTTDSYLTAVNIWHDLLKDKSIMSELNLTAFSKTEEGEVVFQLKGVLNLEELYNKNAYK